jgi:glutamate-5-semialdehyde dehydrogenase
MEDTIKQIAQSARNASIHMAALPSEKKNKALERIAKALKENSSLILAANALDIENAKANHLPVPMQKRLLFDGKKLQEVVQGLLDMARLPDPVGRTTYQNQLDKGLELYRVTCPIGVIGIIFEARPDALVQISALCLKSSNAVLLKGGTEANETNRILAKVIQDASLEEGIPEGWISLLRTRTDVMDLLKLDEEVDLIIPRGSNEFVQMIMNNTRIPVLGHADGVCHAYAHRDCDPAMAIRILLDAKAQYVAVCNAAETILIHQDIAPELLPRLNDTFEENRIQIFGCDRTRAIIDCEPVTDWHTEYLDYKVSVRIVDSLEEAIAHINRYGSGHTEAILTESESAARTFMSLVDAGNVFWNCSTRFSDGFRYGFGAEVGVSTSKIHARGPVGLEGLVTYKYKLFGTGQTVGDYSSGKASFLHLQTDKDCPFDR